MSARACHSASTVGAGNILTNHNELRTLVSEFLLQNGALNASLCLAGQGTLVVSRHGDAVTSDWFGAGGTARGANASVDDSVRAAEWHAPEQFEQGPSDANAGTIAHVTSPVWYGEESLGELQICWRRSAGLESERAVWGQKLARACCLLLKRQQVQAWAGARSNRCALLFGTSAAGQLDLCIECAAWTHIPVVIEGEPGTDMLEVAMAIHASGGRREAPFVIIYCDTQSSDSLDLRQMFTDARGGTICLADVQEFDLPAQRCLLSQLRRDAAATGGDGARVIVSSTTDLHGAAAAGRFLRALLSELDYLPIRVPPLRERTEDIPDIVGHILRAHGFKAEEKCTEEFLQVCSTYSWPRNLCELERVIVRLAVMTGRQPIRMQDVAQHTSWILPTRHPHTDRNDGDASSKAHRKHIEAEAPSLIERWTRRIVNGELDSAGALHEGLLRAMAYLAEHYDEPISLAQLSRHAGVSASHLSYLLKSSLGTTFKPLLSHIRVAAARKMMDASPNLRITDVALNVGFNDLGYFAKSFRRVTGQSPREYRGERIEESNAA